MADDQGNAFDPTLQQAPQTQGQSQDYSQPGSIRQAWSDWTSRPENNAALINFGLQMMQPVPAGQSRMGHFGEAVGAGLEAGGRVSTQEEARQRADEAEALKERAMELKEEETGIYGQDVRSKIAQRGLGMQDSLKRQAAWNKWSIAASKPDDLVSGESSDPVVQRIRNSDKRYAKYTKAQILDDPVTNRMAQDMVMGTTGGGGMSQDQQALQWARQNPGDPRAKRILDRLGEEE